MLLCVKRVSVVLGLLLSMLAVSGCGGGGGAKPAAAKQNEAAGPKPGPTQHYQSRPDLRPPRVKVRVPARAGVGPGYVFFGPKLAVQQAGPMIIDNKGETIWFHPLRLTKGITDFRVQIYQGKRVLTWWRGKLSNVGVGNGYYVVYNDRYKPIAEVRPGRGLAGDVHEFLITPRNTALISIYHRKPVDLTPVSGPAKGKIWDGIVQEIDIKTGKVLFQWNSYPQVGIKESYAKPPKRSAGAKAIPYDYFHLNSIAEDTDGNLLLSARNTHAVYKIDKQTGKVLWRLGGKKSDFTLGPGVRFAWQHDAQRQSDGTISIFDNSAAPPVAKLSRVLMIDANTSTKKATLVRSFQHPKKLLAPFEGNAQFLPNGNVFVGWGAWPYLTEFDRNGRVLFDVYFGHGKKPGQDADSYRSYRFPWRGQPTNKPALAVKRRAAVTTAYASWNGATDVARWVVFAGSDPSKLARMGTWPRSGFETPITIQNDADYYAVEAVSANGKVLARSNAVKPRS
jgi:Arylsulfotransferase (ASST)